MFRNVYYNTKTSKIYLWETDENNNRKQKVIDWVPYVYVPDNNGTIESIFGDKVSKKEFKSYKEYKEFECKNVFENNVVPSIQFLAERYYNIPDEDFKSPELKIYSFDIECYVPRGEGFPDALEAKHPITAISVYDFSENQSYTFGDQEYTGDNKYNTIYKNCGDEVNLLKNFFEWWECNCPDLITGWNTISDTKMNPNGGFDFPYIINRCKYLFGEKTKIYKKLSPINIVNCYISKNGSFNLNIAGVSIIDYMSLYKWYSFDNVPSYSLQYICEKELGIGKLGDGSYDLRDLYLTNYNEYIDYNVVDNLRIKELEDKLGFLKLAQSLCLLCKCPMNMYSTTTSLIEGLMLTRYRRNEMCAPRFVGGKQEPFEAAFVKNPQKGLHKWIFSVDITSSYPFGIITLNMSPETLYGKILGMHDDNIIKYMRKREFPEFKMLSNTKIVEFKGKKLQSFNKALQRKLFSIAPNGAIFVNGKHGVYSDMEREVFSKRKEVKKEMLKRSNYIRLIESVLKSKR